MCSRSWRKALWLELRLVGTVVRGVTGAPINGLAYQGQGGSRGIFKEARTVIQVGDDGIWIRMIAAKVVKSCRILIIF